MILKRKMILTVQRTISPSPGVRTQIPMGTRMRMLEAKLQNRKRVRTQIPMRTRMRMLQARQAAALRRNKAALHRNLEQTTALHQPTLQAQTQEKETGKRMKPEGRKRKR